MTARGRAPFSRAGGRGGEGREPGARGGARTLCCAPTEPGESAARGVGRRHPEGGSPSRTDLARSRIAILAIRGHGAPSLREPREELSAQGAEVEVGSPETGEIGAWEGDGWGDSVPVDRRLAEASVADCDALAPPGGRINPDRLRTEGAAVHFVRGFGEAGKPTRAIRHGPWLLAEADGARGREEASCASIRTDLIDAGGK